MPPDEAPAASAPTDELAELTAELHALETVEGADEAAIAELRAKVAHLEQQAAAAPSYTPPAFELEPNPAAPPLPGPAPATETTPIPAGLSPTAEQVADAEQVAAGNAATIDAPTEPPATTETPADAYRSFLASLDQLVADANTVADLTARGYSLYYTNPETGETGPAIPPAPTERPAADPPAPPALVEGVDVDHEGEPIDAPGPVEPAPVHGVDVPLTADDVLANLLGPAFTGPPPAPPVEPAPVEGTTPTTEGAPPSS